MASAVTDYSPADVIAQMMLYDAAYTEVSDSDSSGVPAGDWPIYVNDEPEADSTIGIPDEVVTIYDTGDGPTEQSYVDGQNVGPAPIQVRVRGATRRVAFDKANKIQRYMAERLDLVYRRGVSIEDRYYVVYAITNFSNPITLGQRVPESRAWVVVFNAMATVQDMSPNT